MKLIRQIVFGSAIFGCASLYAISFTWGPVEDSYDGSWTNALHWKCNYGNLLPNKTPTYNATAIIDNRASYEVTLPPETQLVASTEITMNVGPGETLKLNALGTGLLLGGANEEYFSANPVQFNYSGSQLMQLYAESSKGPYDMLELTNSLVVLSGRGNEGSLVFDGGLVDFRDPCGREWGAQTLPSIVFHRAPIALSSVVFTNGASLRAHTLRLQTCASTNILEFCGGEHYVDQVRIPYTYNQSFSPETDAETTFRLSGGAKMSALSVLIGTKTSGGLGTEKKTTRFIVEGEGSSLETRTSLVTAGDNSGGAGRVGISVLDGAELKLAEKFNINSAQFTTSTVAVIDSKLSSGNRFEFGNGADTHLDFAATNAEISCVRCDAFSAADISIFDTVWTNVTALNLGASSVYRAAPVALEVGGDRSFVGASNLVVSLGSCEHAKLSVTGGKVLCPTLYIGGTAGGNPVQGGANSGTLEVSGGILDVASGDASAYKTAYVGASYGSYGTVNVTGGALNTVSLYVGWCGAAELNVSGGKVSVTSEIRVGNQYKAAAPELRDSVCRISGGEVYVGNKIQVAVAAGRSGTVSLTGGRLTCNQIVGNLGTARFMADGGVLASRSDASNLLNGFADARLGAKGLTVDTPYSVTLSQKFGNAEGAEGLLFLTGAGNKTLSAAESDECRIVVADGVATFSPVSGSQVARTNALLAVTNGAEVAFASAVSQASFKSLSIGSAGSYGALTLYPQTRIVVDDISIDMLCVNFSSALAIDRVYPFITVKGRVDESAAAGWRLARIGRGRSNGMCYRFEVSPYDEVSGCTVLSVATLSSYVPGEENVWKGDSSGSASWDDASNWSGEGHDGSTVAVFNGSSQEGCSAVELPSPAIVGAVSFSNGDFTLCGVGPLAIADSLNGRISVSESKSSIDVPLCQLGSLVVDVAAGSSLSLNGQLRNGGLVKTGDGALFLNGSGSFFENGFTADGGLFAVKDMSVFADLDNVPEVFLKRGTLQIGASSESEEKRFPFALTVAAQSNAEAVVLANDADIVFADGVVATGALVKRGCARATVELTRYRSLSRGNGVSTSTGSIVDLPLNFPADGTAPVGGYAGLTVAEGELRVKTAESAPAMMTADASHQVFLGVWSTNEFAAPPKMTADYAKFSQYYLYAGLNAYVGEYPESARTQYISVVNGGSFTFNTLNVGLVDDLSKSTLDTLLDIDVDNAEFSCRSTININRKNAALNISARNSATVYSGDSPINVKGPLTVNLDSGSVFAGSASAASLINCSQDVDLTANVAGGSTFACKFLNWYKVSPNRFTFNFDNGFWSLGQGEPSRPIAFLVGEQVRFVAYSQGMGFDVPQDVLWQLYHPVYGEGGIFKRGAGTLRIEVASGYNLVQSALTNFANTCVLRCAGPNRVDEGVLVATAGADGASFEVAGDAMLTGEGVVSDLKLSGAGTISGGEFRRLKIVPRADAVLKFDGVVSSGPVKVDLERSPLDPFVELPKNIKVATLAEGFNPSFKWKLVGTGRTNVRGEFRIENGSVYVDAVEAGAIFVIR